MSEFPPVPWSSQARVVARALRPSSGPARPKFVLFAQGRTGSTLFGELLASPPDVVFADEILQAKVRSTRLWVEGQQRSERAPVFGFHVKIYQLTDVQGVRDPGGWLRMMAGNGWTVLTLQRRNLLRHVLSNMTIEATRTVHDRSGHGPRATLHVDPDEVLHWIRVREQVGHDERTALAGVPHEPFTYEDDLQDAGAWQAAADRAYAGLGLSSAIVTTSLHKRNPQDLAELISNYDEVASALRGTPYEIFLD